MFFRLILSLCLFWSYAFSNETENRIPAKVVICGVAKNVAQAVDSTVRSVELLGKCFEDYQVIIYENNSGDSTAAFFETAAKKNKRIHFYSETLKEEELQNSLSDGQLRSLSRTERIALARNKVLQLAMSPKYDDFEYIIMVDLDFKCLWDIDGILSSFSYENEWDAILANGIDSNGDCWDIYSIRTMDYPFGPELYGSAWWSDVNSWRNNFNRSITDPFFPVISAFGGLGIYKRKSIQGCSYSGIPNEDLEEVMSDLMCSSELSLEARSMIDHYKNRRELLPGIQISENGLKWFYDSFMDKKFPVLCEHVPFHCAMIRRGHGKIYINPRMIMKYWQCI